MAVKDAHGNVVLDDDSSASGSRSTADVYYPVTPHDANDLPIHARALLIAVGGTLKVRRLDDVDVTMTVPAGQFNGKVKRVWSTGTAATGITALC